MFQRNNPGEDIIYGLIDGRGSGFKVRLIKMWLKKHLSGQFIHYFLYYWGVQTFLEPCCCADFQSL